MDATTVVLAAIGALASSIAAALVCARSMRESECTKEGVHVTMQTEEKK